MIKTVKVSELPDATSLDGLEVLGVDVSTNKSVKVSTALFGVPGPSGESSYQIAVKNGFQGTEVEWLASLKGEKGSTPEITASINEMGDLLINITK